MYRFASQITQACFVLSEMELEFKFMYNSTPKRLIHIFRKHAVGREYANMYIAVDQSIYRHTMYQNQIVLQEFHSIRTPVQAFRTVTYFWLHQDQCKHARLGGRIHRLSLKCRPHTVES